MDRRHRRVRRSLGVQSLEQRRYLAGDVGSQDEPVYVVSAAASTPAAAAPHAVPVATSSARDAVVHIGSLDGTRQFNGLFSRIDRSDTVQFTVDRPADVSLSLSALKRDANLYLLNEHGEVTGRSEKRGRSTEVIHAALDAGTYYVSVVAAAFGVSPYRLSLSAKLQPKPLPPPPPLAPPPPVLEPVPPAEPAPPATPAEPAAALPTPLSRVDAPVSDLPNPAPMVQPLADIAYFGGAREWNLNSIGAPEAWAAGYTGKDVLVAVIDTGVQLNHPDLIRNLYVNSGEIAGNAVDDDGNGFVDDVHGFDFVDRDSRPDDLNGHGTHVAGIVAAARNHFGATGVAPDAKILPVRVLDRNGSGSDFGVAAGIRYAAQMGADIINLSLGGGYSQAIAAAIDFAHSLGSFIVAAAGNESAAAPGYPARFSATDSHIVSVGAYASSGNIAAFSNAVGTSGAVQVDAPGVGIYSTYLRGRYATLSGTSMAAPHIAGLAALTLSANPKLTSPELRELLSSGTVGLAGGSDAIGSANATTSVAYAAAGLKTSPSRSGGANQASVQATNRVGDFGVRVAEADAVFSSPDTFSFANPAVDKAIEAAGEFGPVATFRTRPSAAQDAPPSLPPARQFDAFFASADTSEESTGRALEDTLPLRGVQLGPWEIAHRQA